MVTLTAVSCNMKIKYRETTPNKGSKPNVIFLLVDSLRFDRLGVGGNNPSPSPVIDQLLQEGLFFTNAYSPGCPTEFAYPALHTGKLPLDDGGYEKGISDRNRSIGNIFKDNGYFTGAFIEDACPSSFGYQSGFHDAFHVYDFSRFVGWFDKYVLYARRMHANGKKSLHDSAKLLVEYLDGLFDDMLEYCSFMISSIEQEALSESLLLHDYDFNALSFEIRHEKEMYQRNRSGYAEELVLNKKSSSFQKIRALSKHHQAHAGTLDVDKAAFPFLLINMTRTILSFFQRRVHYRALVKCIKRLLVGHYRAVFFPSGGYLIDNLIRWIDRRTGDKPFFAWVHTVDVHEQNFTTFDIPGGRTRMHKELAAVLEWSNSCKSYPRRNGSIFYDCAIRYTDIQVGRLVDALKERGIYDNTVIVLASDHGHVSTGWPLRENISIVNDFYDELYHVVFGMNGNGIREYRYDALFSTVDALPVLIWQLGLQSDFNKEAYDTEKGGIPKRDYVIMEDLGPGPSDFNAKPIRVCVRSESRKLTYHVFASQPSTEGEVIAFYNLERDPLETKNLSGAELDEEGKRLMAIAFQRCVDIQQGVTTL